MARFISLALLIALACATQARIEYVDNRIMGGHVADPGEYPSQGSLAYLGDHSCGCTIINEKYILTAARCLDVMIVSSLAVNVGSNHVLNGMVFYQVGRVHLHESFDINDNSSPDIGVANIRDTFIFDTLVVPAVLPAQGAATATGSAALTVGWGFTADVGPISPNLLEVDLIVRDQAQCASIYAAEVALTDAQICADDPAGGKGACTHDVGGPLLVNGEVHGLVSWFSSNGCGAEGFPTVYTRVSSFRDWIDMNTIIA